MTVRSRAAGERGSATVWVVALSGVLAAIGVAAVLVGAAVVGRHRATAAADLAALAAAEHAVRGDPGACAAAELGSVECPAVSGAPCSPWAAAVACAAPWPSCASP